MRGLERLLGFNPIVAPSDDPLVPTAAAFPKAEPAGDVLVGEPLGGNCFFLGVRPLGRMGDGAVEDALLTVHMNELCK